MSRATQAQEPSMEEILASIRRIISDDETPARAEPAAASAGAASEAAPPLPASEAEPGEPAESNSQDDIDALFASDDMPGAGMAEPEEAAVPSGDDDILDLTEDMRAPEADQDEAAGADEAASAEAAFDRDDEVIFREPASTEPMEGEAAADRQNAAADIAASMAALDAARIGERAEERLLSPNTDVAVSAAFSNLATLILSKDARTLEDLVKEMLRPMLKTWLDDNLPQLVERMVREEIERVSRGRR